MTTILDRILSDVRDELASAKANRPSADIRARLADAPPVRPMDSALAHSFGLIAEIKERSPSVGAMRPENVKAAPQAYAETPLVHAVSILTNFLHFGMSIERLSELRPVIPKPILRKDFFIDEYQIREARAFGADAILLMANVLDSAQLAGFYDLARELGMQALFEVHTREEIQQLPPDARIVGINSRKFRTTEGFVGASGESKTDFSVSMDVFELVTFLPTGCIRIAESGLSAENIGTVANAFNAALVGTSLLRDPSGIRSALDAFVLGLQNT